MSDRHVEDELITIRAPGRDALSGFVEQRSVLCRSPTLAEFFESHHYVPGTKMSLWFLRDDALVVYVAIQYLLLGDEFSMPYFMHLPLAERVQVLIRIYFLAKRLCLGDLEDMAHEELLFHEDSLPVCVIPDLARNIYRKTTEKDDRIRGYLQRAVELNIRALLNNHEWRCLLREAHPSLAADMFELVSTILLNGEAAEYPPDLPQQYPEAVPRLRANQTLCAVVIRNYYPSNPFRPSVTRGDQLRDCRVQDDGGISWEGDHEQSGGWVPRDHVELLIETDPDLDMETGSHEPLLHDKVEFHGAVTRGNRDKASWVLGMDILPDVFDPDTSKYAETSTSAGTPKTAEAPKTAETPKASEKSKADKGGWKHKLDDVFSRSR